MPAQQPRLRTTRIERPEHPEPARPGSPSTATRYRATAGNDRRTAAGPCSTARARWRAGWPARTVPRASTSCTRSTPPEAGNIARYGVRAHRRAPLAGHPLGVVEHIVFDAIADHQVAAHPTTISTTSNNAIAAVVYRALDRTQAQDRTQTRDQPHHVSFQDGYLLTTTGPSRHRSPTRGHSSVLVQANEGQKLHESPKLVTPAQRYDGDDRGGAWGWSMPFYVVMAARLPSRARACSEGLPGSAWKMISCWPGALLTLNTSQVRFRSPTSRWWKRLASRVYAGDVMARPQPAEVLAFEGELTDQFDQVRVVEVRSRGGAQVGHLGTGDLLPVPVELACGGVQEDQPEQVVRVLQSVVEDGGQRVRGQHVQPAVEHERRGVRPAPHQPQQVRADLLRLAGRSALPRPRDGRVRTGAPRRRGRDPGPAPGRRAPARTDGVRAPVPGGRSSRC